LNVQKINRIDCHPAERDEDSAPQSIFDTKIVLDWNGEVSHPMDSEDG